MKVRIKDILLLVLGNLLLALAYELFIVPLNIVGGGSGGLSVVLHSLFPSVSASVFVTVFVVLMFILGAIILGKSFALKTLASTIIYPIGIWIFEFIPGLKETAISIDNPLVAAIFGGILSGFGVGFIFLTGGSSGGVDVPGYIIHKYFKRIRIEKAIFIIDCVIILAGIFIVGIQEALYGIIFAYICMIVTDKVLVGGNENYMLVIVSEKYEEINEFIIKELDHSSTLYPSIGGYTKEKKTTIQVVIRKSDFYVLQRFIKQVDADAFYVIINAGEVYGEGFIED